MAKRKTTAKFTKPSAGAGVDDYLAASTHPMKPAVIALRRLILAADSRIGEEIKWNAPSFFIEEHFATFRLNPPPVCQLILHTGAKKQAKPSAMTVADPEGLMKWAAKDRAIIEFSSIAEAKAKGKAVASIIGEWIRQM